MLKLLCYDADQVKIFFNFVPFYNNKVSCFSVGPSLSIPKLLLHALLKFICEEKHLRWLKSYENLKFGSQKISSFVIKKP